MNETQEIEKLSKRNFEEFIRLIEIFADFEKWGFNNARDFYEIILMIVKEQYRSVYK